ncbi:MAG TPA: hypothetical protein VLS90_06675 [Thermodesulfobacteriota bacterium]|nr:hypothetical protein [Thermodesulfobacteriota bacterium]
MTHSLHREGPLELLNEEFVIFVYPARGFNYDGSAPKVRRLGEMLFQQGPANLLVTTLRENMYRAVSHEQILDSIKDGAKIFCVMDTREKFKETLAKIKKIDAGISIVVSGVMDRIREISAELGIDPHTVNISLGIHGNTDRLPPPDIRQFTTMCGHGMVSPNLIRDLLRRVKTGKVPLREASLIAAAPCS